MKSLPLIPLGVALSFVSPTLLINNAHSDVEPTQSQPQTVVEQITQAAQPDPSPNTNSTVKPPMEVTPEWKVIRALIRTIYWAEGTKSKPNPYGVGYAFTQVGLEKHPDEDGDFCLPIGVAGWEGQCSSAAGAGQWILGTWNGMQERYPWVMDIVDPFCPVEQCEFAPVQQDMMMYFKLKERGSLEPILAAIYHGEDGATLVEKEVFVEEMDKSLSREWASIPCLTGPRSPEVGGQCSGGSYYGQGGKNIEDLWSVFNEELAKENQGEWQRQYQQIVEMELTQ